MKTVWLISTILVTCSCSMAATPKHRNAGPRHFNMSANRDVPLEQRIAGLDADVADDLGLEGDLGGRAEVVEGAGQQAETKVIVEGEVQLSVEMVEPAAEKIRALVVELGGKVTGEEITPSTHSAQLKVRIPPGSLEQFLEQLEEIGDISYRGFRSLDVTKRFVDNRIKLQNLERTLARYQEILATAKTVEEMLAVEEQLGRVRERIELIKGELKWLSDQVDLSTIDLYLYGKTSAVEFAPKAKFHPGVRYGGMRMFAKDQAGIDSFGPGVSLHFDRRFHIDLDVLADSAQGMWRADAVLVTMGFDAYSDFLGRGQRAFLNPYLGSVLGYAQIDGASHFLFGANVGVELVKSKHLLLQAGVRVHGLVGSGPMKLGVQPTATLNVAF